MHAAAVTSNSVEGLRNDTKRTFEVPSQTMAWHHEKADRSGTFCSLYILFNIYVVFIENALLKAILHTMMLAVLSFILWKKIVLDQTQFPGKTS
jgi:hypothetical protein